MRLFKILPIKDLFHVFLSRKCIIFTVFTEITDKIFYRAWVEPNVYPSNLNAVTVHCDYYILKITTWTLFIILLH